MEGCEEPTRAGGVMEGEVAVGKRRKRDRDAKTPSLVSEHILSYRCMHYALQKR